MSEAEQKWSPMKLPEESCVMNFSPVQLLLGQLNDCGEIYVLIPNLRNLLKSFPDICESSRAFKDSVCDEKSPQIP